MATHLDIPALPVLLPLGATLMVVSWVLLRRGGTLTVPRLAATWFAVFYACAVLGATMLPMHLAWGPGAGDAQLYRFILVPILEMRPMDFVLNTVMTLPLAAILHTVFGVRDQRRVVLTGFALSAAIEVTQGLLLLTLHGSRWADVNDLMSNTLGAYLGYLLFQRLMRFAPFRRAVESAEPARGTPVTVR
ncbi:glycopeptide antibiotics resistance protein [Actinoplanes lutulentus]|uniref:VanZ like protein n=1 Tax=Actinoplanes lutulentus TaxID=1287878 RepID=A0A327ZJS9_9ACTN|nr:VanZ family protein [Actinoplanes lutulentus]MBB2944532.1 glycopeptide antibiotics resistance protein [Actinoplanes lutulentus]RAK42236.1 VanZ like protein [Actinoplanes lutulentus]